MKRRARTNLRSGLVAVVLAIVGVCGTFLFWWMSRSLEAPASGGAATEPRLPRLVWPEGQRQVFRLTYRNRDELRPLVTGEMAKASMDPISSVLSLEATVAVTGEETRPEDGQTRITFEVLSSESAFWKVAGQVAWTDAAACEAMLVGASLGAEVGPTGITTALYDAPGAETSAQSALQALWLRMQFALPERPVAGGTKYWAQETGLQATAMNAYTVREPDDTSSGGWVLDRTTHGYQGARAAANLPKPRVRGTGSASITIEGSGLLLGLRGDERIEVQDASGHSVFESETSFHFEWLRSEAAHGSRDVSSLEHRAPDSIRVSADLPGKVLDNRIAGLDRETLLDTLRMYGNGGQLPDEARFLWRATGLLQKHPELARELLPIYRHPSATSALQGTVLDLLASVGHEDAQAVMREMLGDPRVFVEGGVASRHLYQRLGHIGKPSPETAEMVAEHYRELSGSGFLEAQLTTAYTLGAIVGKLSEGDDEARALAASYNEVLARDLYNADDPAVLAHRVTALGSTRRPDNVAELSTLAGHDSARVRERVAHALGRAGAETPPPALLTLLGDDDRLVQQSAIRVSAPDEAVYDRIAEDVSAGRVAQFNVRAILDLVKKGRQSHRESTTRVLDALLERGIADDKDRGVALVLRSM